MKIRVLVTGSNGQLGKTLKHLFFVNQDNIEFNFFDKNKLDITSEKSLRNKFSNKEFQFCINCAAYTNVELAETEEENAFLVNAYAVKTLALVCKEFNVVLIHISTDYVFDGLKIKPYTVEDITDPINIYGKSKRQGEIYLEGILNEYYIIRASWLYSIFNKNFLKTIVSKINQNLDLNITTEQTGTPTSCEDLSYFIYFIIKEKIPFGTYHFSAQGSGTWFDFAKQISINFKNYDPYKLKEVQSYISKAARPKRSVLDLSKTEKAYKKLNMWETSVKHTVLQIRSKLSLL